MVRIKDTQNKDRHGYSFIRRLAWISPALVILTCFMSTTMMRAEAALKVNHGNTFSFMTPLIATVDAVSEVEIEKDLLAFRRRSLPGFQAYDTELNYPHSDEYYFAWTNLIVALGSDTAIILTVGQSETVVHIIDVADIAVMTVDSATGKPTEAFLKYAAGKGVDFATKELVVGKSVPGFRSGLAVCGVFDAKRQDEKRVTEAITQQLEIQQFVGEATPIAVELRKKIKSLASESKRTEYSSVLSTMLQKTAELAVYRQMQMDRYTEGTGDLEQAILQIVNPGLGTNYTVSMSFDRTTKDYVRGFCSADDFMNQVRATISQNTPKPEGIMVSNERMTRVLKQLAPKFNQLDRARKEVNRYGGSPAISDVVVEGFDSLKQLVLLEYDKSTVATPNLLMKETHPIDSKHIYVPKLWPNSVKDVVKTDVSSNYVIKTSLEPVGSTCRLNVQLASTGEQYEISGNGGAILIALPPGLKPNEEEKHVSFLDSSGKAIQGASLPYFRETILEILKAVAPGIGKLNVADMVEKVFKIVGVGKLEAISSDSTIFSGQRNCEFLLVKWNPIYTGGRWAKGNSLQFSVPLSVDTNKATELIPKNGLGAFFYAHLSCATANIGIMMERPQEDTTTASQKDVIVNSIGMRLKYIPPGEFMMGSSEDEKGRGEDEGPRHIVKLTSGFYMGVTEVTQEQWFQVMNTRPWSYEPGIRENADYPAAYICWVDAMEFCRKLGRMEDRIYRLPTEAEWEYACRGGTNTAYSFGDDPFLLGNYAWFEDNAGNVGEDYAHKVGMKLPNPWDLYDMHGNVWEWCSDWFNTEAYSAILGVDPVGLHEGSHERVIRGGSWHLQPGDCRSAGRAQSSPYMQSSVIGFRVLLDSSMDNTPSVANLQDDETIKSNYLSPRTDDTYAIDVARLTNQRVLDYGKDTFMKQTGQTFDFNNGEFRAVFVLQSTIWGSPHKYDYDSDESLDVQRAKILKQFGINTDCEMKPNDDKVEGFVFWDNVDNMAKLYIFLDEDWRKNIEGQTFVKARRGEPQEFIFRGHEVEDGIYMNKLSGEEIMLDQEGDFFLAVGPCPDENDKNLKQLMRFHGFKLIDTAVDNLLQMEVPARPPEE